MQPIKLRVWYREDEEMHGIDDIRDADYTRRRFFALEDLDVNEVTGDWMLFTGLKDKNGEEIYEGDILQFEKWETHTRPEKEGIFMEQVLWNKYQVRFELTGSWPRLSAETAKECTIVGNIYEHAHLLNDNT